MPEGREVLTALDVALRLEAKVDIVLADHEERLRVVEKGGIILRGIWMTLGVICGVIAGTAGLVMGALTLFSNGAS
jgi:hypothetical protein